MRSTLGKVRTSRNIDLTRRCAVVLCLAAAAVKAQDVRGGAGEDQAPAISYERLMDYLRWSGRDNIADAMAIKLIERFGLAFRPTADELGRLGNVPGARSLTAAIERARIPAPPPVILEAALSITCAPVDCDIWVNDRRLGRTQGGTLPWVVLPPGKISVSAAMANYETTRSRSELVLASGERRKLEFVFQPPQSDSSAVGARLLQQMFDAIGGREPANVPLRAAGTLYLRDEAGEIVPWSIVAWIRGGQLIRVQTSRLKERVELIRTEGATWRETSRSAAASQLSAAVALLEPALLPNQMRAMNAAGASAVACNSDLPVARFRIEGAAGGSIVTLDSFSRPSQIEREIRPGSRATILYSDYSQLPGLMWPAVIEVLFADSRRGIAVRFSSVQRVETLPEGMVRSSH